nr:MarR family transcriptional regulator [Herbiconiux sp. VKM Ac-1786]
MIREFGLAPGQESVLMLLWESEPRTQSEITRALGVEPPTAAKALARMEAAGFLERTRSSADARVMLVTLTEKGRALETPVRAAWATLEERTVGSFSEADRTEFARLIRQAITGVERSHP